MVYISGSGGVATPELRTESDPAALDRVRGKREASRPGFLGSTVGTLGLAVPDLVDTIASSVLPGVERGDVNQTFLDAIGSSGLNRFAAEQQGATELVSGIAGIVIADRLAFRAFKPASRVMTTMRQMPAVRHIAALDKQYATALRAAQIGMRESATRGNMGAAAMTANLNFKSLGVNTAVDLGKARSRTRGFQAAIGARHAVGTEMFMAAGLNTNSIFYTDDWSDNLAWMSVGVGLGAGIGGLQGAWALRRSSNSKAIEGELARAYDPRGHEAARRAIGVVDDDSSKSFWGYDHELTTDSLTSAMLHAKESRLATGTSQRGVQLGANRTEFATELERSSFQALNKVTSTGLNGVAHTSFTDASREAFGALKAGLHKEPTLLYGATEVGVPNVDVGIRGTDAARQLGIDARIDALQESLNSGMKKVKEGKKESLIPLTDEEMDDMRAALKKLWYDNSKVGMVQLIPGELAPIEFGTVVDNLAKRQVIMESSTDKRIWQAAKVPDADSVIGVGDDLGLFLGAGRHVNQLSVQESIHLYRTARKAVQSLATKMPDGGIQLADDANWFQLDMAEQLLRVSNGAADVKFPKGMTREEAIVESFAQKVDAIRGQKSSGLGTAQALQGASKYGRTRAPLNDIDAFAARVKYNLPQLTPHQSSIFRSAESPIDDILYSAKSGDEIRADGIQGLREKVRAAGAVKGMTDDIVREFEDVSGKSYSFLMDDAGDAIDPVLVYKRQMAPDDWSRQALDTSIASRKAHRLGVMIGDTADPLTRMITQTLISSPDFQQALKVGQLADNQHASWLPGLGNAAPQSPAGALTDALNVGGREFRDRDIQTMLSASRIKDLQDRITRDVMAKVMESSMGDIMTRVAAPRAGQSRVLLNQFFSHRQGWSLAEDIVEGVPTGTAKLTQGTLADGSTGYYHVLANTPENQARFEQQFGRAMGKKELLPNAQGQPMVLDDLGLEALTRFNKATDTRRLMQNTLLRSQGMPEIQRQLSWVPSPETQGKFVAFTFGPDGKVIPGGSMVANTAEQLVKMEEDLMKSGFWQNGFTIRRRDTVTSYMDLWDKAQMDWHNPMVTAVQSGRMSQGRLGGQSIDMKAWDRAAAQLVNGFVDHGSDILNSLTKDSVLAAKQRAEAARVETAIGRSDRDLKHAGIHDRYIQNITGRQSSANQQGMIAPMFSAMETRINSFLRARTPTSSQTYQTVADYFRSVPFFSNKLGMRETNKELFDKMVQNLGPNMPFKSALELVEAQSGHAIPLEVKKISAKLSWMEATSKLRWLESVHALMNFGSLVHNMPSITKGLQKLGNETDEEWAKRIGHVGSIFGDRHKVAAVNPAKILYGAFQDARATQLDEFTEKATRRGFMNQEVAELERQFNAIKTPGAARAFFFGDAHADTSTLAGRIAKKGGLDYYLGYMSDKSEDFTRRIAMYYGRRLAQQHGIENVDDQVMFAHDIANKAIANYDPRNRPEIFQGWLGAPIGLFQSYVTNFYSRMLRLVETGNTKALMSQAIWQGSVFGIQSFGPAFKAANRLFFDKGESLEDGSDSLHKRLGTADGDLLLYGVLSNLPKLFGGEAASFYTRGDTNIRAPVVNMPIADSIKRVWDGTNQALDMFMDNTQGVTVQQSAEILSNTLGNRPLAGMIETFGAGGYDTDKSGQVILQNETLASLNSMYRLVGIRSMGQQKAIEAFYANKEAGEQLEAKRTTLNLETRARIRAGDFDSLPPLFVAYVENGGDKRYFTKWFNNAMESSLETRSDRQLTKLMKNGKKMAQINRLLDSGVEPFDAASADDYGAEEQIKKTAKMKVDEMFAAQEESAQQTDEVTQGGSSLFDE